MNQSKKGNEANDALRVCGVIAEYDPFHNGHAYHLRKLRAEGHFDYIVCVMSGHFTQRGSPALVSKWARAEMALRCGADAVFELPTLFAVRDAERFARGGAALLTGLSVVTHIGFGSEAGDLATLQREAERGEDRERIRAALRQGQTLARARDLLAGTPNDILGVEYLRALKRLESPLIPVCVRREGSGYHEDMLSARPSATAVRAAFYRRDDVSGSMPAAAYALLARLQAAGAYQKPGGLDTALLACLRSMTAEVLCEIADVGEGLENRILRAAHRASSRTELLSMLKCKRYTWARLSRVLTQAQLGMTKAMAEENGLPAYARLLGFRRDAAPLMRAISQRAGIPIVTRVAKHQKAGGDALQLDIRAGGLWALGMKSAAHRGGDADFIERVVIVEP